MAKVRREMQPNDVDWVFCWRTSTGEARPGSREVGMKGRPISVRPESPHSGLRTIIRRPGRMRPQPVTGPRLDQQGAMSRMGIHVLGYVTEPHLVPARNQKELALLRAAAHAAMGSGAASEWALAAVHARGRIHPAIHVDAGAAVVADIAASVEAPWTLHVRERVIDSGRTARK